MTPLQQACLEYLRPEEGGLVDHPKDPGGITKYGISLRWLRAQGPIVGDVDGDGDVDADDIRALSREQADALYLRFFWLPAYDSLSYAVAARVFSHHVNAGPKAAGIVLQRALRACGAPGVKEDGAIGPRTVSAAYTAPQGLVEALRSERAGFYRRLVALNAKFEDFEAGWLNRAYR